MAQPGRSGTVGMRGTEASQYSGDLGSGRAWHAGGQLALWRAHGRIGRTCRAISEAGRRIEKEIRRMDGLSVHRRQGHPEVDAPVSVEAHPVVQRRNRMPSAGIQDRVGKQSAQDWEPACGLAEYGGYTDSRSNIHFCRAGSARRIGLSGQLCIAIRLSHQKALHSHLTKLANYANISHWLTVT